MAKPVVPLFVSHLCVDHSLVADVRSGLHRGEQRGAFPPIRLVFGCPVLSGRPPGSSVSEAWEQGIDGAAGTLFLWTKEALYAEGTTKEWKRVRDGSRPHFFAVEAGADLPSDIDGDERRVELPLEIGYRGIWWNKATRPVLRYLPQYGDRGVRFLSEVRAFAKDRLTPLA